MSVPNFAKAGRLRIVRSISPARCGDVGRRTMPKYSRLRGRAQHKHTVTRTCVCVYKYKRGKAIKVMLQAWPGPYSTRYPIRIRRKQKASFTLCCRRSGRERGSKYHKCTVVWKHRRTFTSARLVIVYMHRMKERVLFRYRCFIYVYSYCPVLYVNHAPCARSLREQSWQLCSSIAPKPVHLYIIGGHVSEPNARHDSIVSSRARKKKALKKKQ